MPTYIAETSGQVTACCTIVREEDVCHPPPLQVSDYALEQVPSGTSEVEGGDEVKRTDTESKNVSGEAPESTGKCTCFLFTFN